MSGRLLVFLHVATKQRALQSALQGALPGATVTAVGRVADFERALTEGHDVVLARSIVLLGKGLTPQLQGHRQSSPDEPYALVGTSKAPDPQHVKSVGALDLLGRDGTTAFVHDLVGAQPKVERVTKVEDLLPLLQMQVADAILVPARMFADVKAVSRLELLPTELPKRVRLPALASTSAAGPQLIAAIARIPQDVLSTLGVDAWR